MKNNKGIALDKCLGSIEEIIGCSPEHFVPWEKDGKLTVADIDNKNLRENYKNWLIEAMGSKKKHFCFVDITITNLSATELGGFIIVPEDNQFTIYCNAIKELNRYMDKEKKQELCRTVGSHKVFIAGLPKFKNCNNNELFPQTQEELSKILKEFKSQKTRLSSNLFFEHFFETNSLIKSSMQPKKSGNFFINTLTNRDIGYTNQKEYGEALSIASSYSIQDNWNIFVEILKKYQNDLLSAERYPLKYVVGVPLTQWLFEEKSGGIIYHPLAQIFIGIGGEGEKKIRDYAFDLLKKMISHIYNIRSISSIRYISLSEGEKRGAKLSGTISGHEAGAQLAAMRNLMPYISDTNLRETALKLIYGSMNYVHLYLADNPGTSEIRDFYIKDGESLKVWVEKIAKLSWQIALAREIRDEEIKAELLDKLEELIERNMPGIKFEIPDDLIFKPSEDIEKKYPNFRPTFSRWFLAGLSNSIKWSGQLEGRKNLEYWIIKKSSAFKSIKIEIIHNREEKSFTIAILNEYYYINPKESEECVGTQRVLEVINENLPQKEGSFKFGQKNNQDEFETSITLEGEIFGMH